MNYNSAKMGLQMKRRFWEQDDHTSADIFTRTCRSASSRPSNDYFTQKGAYSASTNGPVGNLPIAVAARIEHVLSNASKVSANPHRVRAYAVVAQGEIQRRRLPCPQRRAPREAVEVDNRILIGSAAVTPHSNPTGGRRDPAGWQALKLA